MRLSMIESRRGSTILMEEKPKDETRPQPVREEYGEPDRPMPEAFIQDIQDKFSEWQVYKMQSISN